MILATWPIILDTLEVQVRSQMRPNLQFWVHRYGRAEQTQKNILKRPAARDVGSHQRRKKTETLLGLVTSTQSIAVENMAQDEPDALSKSRSCTLAAFARRVSGHCWARLIHDDVGNATESTEVKTLQKQTRP